MIICSVYDKKAMTFFPPFTCENKVVAIRSLEGTVNSSGNVINRYPDDFALYTLGDFDEKTGNITCFDIKVLECECRQLVQPTEVPNFNSGTDGRLSPSGEGAVVIERSKN